MQLSKIIIGQLLLVIVAAGFLVFISDGVSKYSVTVPAGYNETLLKFQNNLNNISNSIGTTRDNLNVNTNGGLGINSITDFVGYFFNAGYKAMKTVTAVVELNFDLIDVVVDNAFPGTFGDIVRVVFVIIILVVIMIAILMRTLTKGDTI